MKRVLVCGTSGSGKTTLAKLISRRLGNLHFELDALHWEENWMGVSREVLQDRVAESVTNETWVIDGNYGAVRDQIMARADTLIWLDYPFHIPFFRVIRRTFTRLITREVLWNKNTESWRDNLFSKESIIWWVVTTHKKRRQQYEEIIRENRYPHAQIVRIKSPRELQQFLETQSG